MKILVTGELGRLAKWLRILGLDTEYSPERNNASLVVRALREERIILTRNHHLPAARGLRIVVLKEEILKKQLQEVLRGLEITPQQQEMFRRCTVCNQELVHAARDRVKDKVPEYVFATQENFWICAECARVYWQGTHWGNVRQTLEELKG